MGWQDNVLTSTHAIHKLLQESFAVAVLGIKTESQAAQPAFYVPQYLVRSGFSVFPVPVYYPEVTEILGQPVYRKLSEIDAPLDIVNVFRRDRDLPAHVEDILAARPKAVWLQSGIRHDEVARTLAENGILVVQNRCIMVEHRATVMES